MVRHILRFISLQFNLNTGVLHNLLIVGGQDPYEIIGVVALRRGYCKPCSALVAESVIRVSGFIPLKHQTRISKR